MRLATFVRGRRCVPHGRNQCAVPVFRFHAENDHIIPFSDGQALFDACPAPDKRFFKVAGANHNDIFALGMPRYMEEVKALTQRVAGQGGRG